MQTILAPTDFSKIARNAIEYAVEIAKRSSAKLVLLHVYEPPIISAEVPILLPVADIEKGLRTRLERIKKNLLAKHGKKISVECQVSGGFVMDEINSFAKENKADLVVMGIAGAGYIKEKLIGNTTTSVIKNATFPVIAVHKNVKYKSLKKIALACDFKETKHKLVLNPLKNLANTFKSHIYILNVVPPSNSIPTISKAVEGIKLDHSLEGAAHSFHIVENEDVVSGINHFVDKNKMDMVAMIPRKHSIFKNVFKERNTKRLAFHTKVPLLALHE
jgi:nucleotide-binding universal stress UspA family protein